MSVRRQFTAEPRIASPDLTYAPEHLATKEYVANALSAFLVLLSKISGGTASSTGPLNLYGGTASSTYGSGQVVSGGTP